MRPPTPLQHKIPYEIAAEPLEGMVTGLGGAAIASRAFRSMQLPGLFDANLACLRRISLGHVQGQLGETVCTALLLGAENVADIAMLTQDPAIEKMFGYTPAATRTVRDWLERFHDEPKVTQARQRAEQLSLKAFIPEPSAGLRGLQAVLGASAREAAKRLPAGSPAVATVDLDATITASHKRAAQWTYEGVKGYQPVVAAWAEAAVVLATEFRDGNVPASMAPLGCAKLAFAELPAGVQRRGFRGDSACDEQHLLGWLDDEQRPGGPAGRIDYAISARMCPELKAASAKVPDAAWRTFGHDADGTLRQWAELDYVPGLPSEPKGARPRRYAGLRFLKPQGTLFDDGSDRKHFAVVTNRSESGEKVIAWHREKAGTIEHTHDELKNALAAGAPPSQKFGANAAWFALNAITFNLAAALRAAAPDPDLADARLKRLRLRLLTAGARLTRFSRKITLRFAAPRAWIAHLLQLLRAFPCRIQPTG
jgi:hypothetical protein